MKTRLALKKALKEARKQKEKPASSSVEVIFKSAISMEASDVHLDPNQEDYSLRFRLDGVLQAMASIPRSFAPQLIARLKVLANLLTYREDIPQEGRIGGYPTDDSPPVRVSIFPALGGEKVTLRLFESVHRPHTLDSIGFDRETREEIEEAIFKPQGLFLLTGPSGSGKTTTIYAILRALADEGDSQRSLFTLEDPVEIPLPQVTQALLNRQAGLDFSTSLRHLLRHDPDVIMIGEIRDRETAEIAIEAGLTGHFIISTIHSGRAVGVFNRLLEMGVEPYLITASVTAVLAQRLVRQLCLNCEKSPHCPHCFGTGFSGRKILYEYLSVDGELRRAILNRSEIAEYEKIIKSRGIPTLLDRARQMVEEEKTRAEEIQRVLGRK